jgi:putative endonuclease
VWSMTSPKLLRISSHSHVGRGWLAPIISLLSHRQQGVHAAGMPGDTRSGAARLERLGRYWLGVLGELIAACVLMAHGYRVLARRYRSAAGEIDLIAVRGRRLAFIEVKCRRSREVAIDAITPAQRRRVLRAADHWRQRHPYYDRHEPGFDAVLLTPRSLPYYWRDAFPFACR